MVNRRRKDPLHQWLASKPEIAFQRELLDTAGYLGWMRFHDHDARRDNESAGVDRGFPDSVLVHPDQGRLLFAELKTERGRLSKDQERWLEALRRVRSIEVYSWKPRDWDRVLRVLQGQEV